MVDGSDICVCSNYSNDTRKRNESDESDNKEPE